MILSRTCPRLTTTAPKSKPTKVRRTIATAAYHRTHRSRPLSIANLTPSSAVSARSFGPVRTIWPCVNSATALNLLRPKAMSGFSEFLPCRATGEHYQFWPLALYTLGHMRRNQCCTPSEVKRHSSANRLCLWDCFDQAGRRRMVQCADCRTGFSGAR